MKPESALQRSIRHYLTLNGIDSVAVPNGAHLSGDASARARQMNAMKADGLRVGFPDLLLYPRRIAAIGHFEIKREGGKLSPAQTECIAWLQGRGHRVAVIRSIEDARDTLVEWGWLHPAPDCVK